MEEKTVFTVADLAKRWQCSDNAIRSMVNTRKLKKIPGVPGIKFLVRYIEDLEELGMDTDPFSQFERRRLEKERDYWKGRAEKLEEILKKIRIETAIVLR